jgi:uridine phosphorylase
MLKHFPATDLVLNAKNQVYHLGLSPENLATKIIVVGDQDRVGLISQYFESIEHKSQHREFTCHTGLYQGKRISVLSTGIGTDNIDIVVNELDALVNIDLINRTEKEDKTTLEIVRIGTCGILNPSVPILSYILSNFSFGLDNIAHFYAVDFSSHEINLNQSINEHIQLPKTIHTYVAESSERLNSKLISDKTVQGITVTSSGFYGPQGRQLRIGLATNDMNEKLSSYNKDNLTINNFEMESSALHVLGKALGHDCSTICLGIGNRQTKEFATSYQTEMNELIQYVLGRI